MRLQHTQAATSAAVRKAAATLGLDPSTALDCPDTLKSAFRKTALASHPDTASGGVGDGAAFQAASVAYKLLQAELERRKMAASADRAREVRANPEEQARRAKETWAEFDNSKHAHYDRFRKAMAADDAAKESQAADAEAMAAAYTPKQWREALRSGWTESGFTTARADTSTGYKFVTTTSVTVTAPDGSSGQGVWEDWTSVAGIPRRRTVITMPQRFALARAVFGNEDLNAGSDMDAAVAEFGRATVLAARVRKKALGFI